MKDPTPDELALRQKPLAQFRARTLKLSIHPLEKLLLWVIGLHLVFLPWALGTMHVWSQVVSFTLAVIGMVVALIPRNYTEEHTGEGRFRLYMWPKLWRFPIFWFGLTLLGYVLIQALNPAWVFVMSARGWWMEGIPHVSWLPSGTDSPFTRSSPWRTLMIYTTVWLVVNSVWIGFTRRRSLQILLITIATNGVVLALLGLVQRFTNAPKLFWFWTSPSGDSFFASFIYRNHAGAYLNLVLAVTCGLASWYYLRGLRRLEKSNPAGLFVFFATIVAVSVIISFSRGSTLTMLAFLLIAVVSFLIRQWTLTDLPKKPVVTILLVVLFGAFARLGLQTINLDQTASRFSSLFKGTDLSVTSRELAAQATRDMTQEAPVFGHGAGSFRLLFPAYQQHYPEIFSENGRRLYWEHAHNDYLETKAELGWVGCGLLGLILGWWLVLLARTYFWENPLSLTVVLGMLLTLCHAWGDFVFQCPAILITWCALWPLAAHWTIFEENNTRG